MRVGAIFPLTDTYLRRGLSLTGPWSGYMVPTLI